MVEPPYELQICFDEIERCSALLQHKRTSETRDPVHFTSLASCQEAADSLSTTPQRSQDLRFKRSQRATAVSTALKAAWSKATGGNAPYDLSEERTSPALVSVAVQILRDQFEWIEVQDLVQHPTAQVPARCRFPRQVALQLILFFNAVLNIVPSFGLQSWF